MKLPKELEELKRFHGHLGPYAVIGLKMGQVANQYLGESGFGKKAVIETGTTPPISCIVDGIQFSSGCTLGKGNIEVKDQKQPIALFSNGQDRIKVQLRKEMHRRIDGKMDDQNMERISVEIYEMKVEEVLEIKRF